MNVLSLTNTWYEVKDGDPRAVGLYRRHYSCRNYNHGQKIDYVRLGFSGPGESLIMMTSDCTALFGWLKSIRDDGQEGVNDFVFRNEGPQKSSDLIKAACEMAWQKWGNVRLFTFIDPEEVRTGHPKTGIPNVGKCYLKAGWTFCGYSKGGLLILEKVLK